jgi:hypothetical protein
MCKHRSMLVVCVPTFVRRRELVLEHCETKDQRWSPLADCEISTDPLYALEYPQNLFELASRLPKADMTRGAIW